MSSFHTSQPPPPPPPSSSLLSSQSAPIVALSPAAGSESVCPPMPSKLKLSKQSTSSTVLNSVASDQPFQPHTTHRHFYAAPSKCPCGLRSDRRVLIVGDGDLSYSIGLIRHWRNTRLHTNEVTEDYYHNAQLIIRQQGEEKEAYHPCHQPISTSPAVSSASAICSSSSSSAALPQLLVDPPFDPLLAPELTCTTYEEIDQLSQRYKDARSNAALLRKWGVKVLHGVDARRLETYANLMPYQTERQLGFTNDLQDTHSRTRDVTTPSVGNLSFSSSSSSSSTLGSSPSLLTPPLSTFHTIVFHFPHVGGKSRIHLNRALLTDFLQSAEKLIVQTGDKKIVPTISSHSTRDTEIAAEIETEAETETAPGSIHVSLIRGQGGTPCDTRQRPNYGDHWQLIECAARANLVLSHVFPFGDGLYPGYNNRGYRSRDEEFFWRGIAITHVMTPGTRRSAKETNRETLIEEIQHKIEQQLCQQRHHPLQAIDARMKAFMHSVGKNSAPSDRLRRLPFADVSKDYTVSDKECSSIVRAPLSPPSSLPTSIPVDYSKIYSHVTTSPCVPILSIDASTHFRPDLLTHLSSLMSPSMSSSSSTPSSVSVIITGPVVESCAHLDSLQWNLDPMLSVTADMEKELPQPIVTQLKSQLTSIDDRVVPFMRGGVPITHHQLTVQLFDTIGSSVDDSNLVVQDLADTAVACMRHLFSDKTKIRIVPSYHPFTIQTNSTISSEQNSPLQFTISHDIQLQFDEVWHVVGRSGTFNSLSNSSSASPSSSSSQLHPLTPTRLGWLIEWSLDKLSMLKYHLHDVRWLWSRDDRVVQQFQLLTQSLTPTLPSTPASSERPLKFIPFSIHPLAYVRDTSFWIQTKEANVVAGPYTQISSPIEGPPLKKQKCVEIDLSSGGSSLPLVGSSSASPFPYALSIPFVSLVSRSSLIGPSFCSYVEQTDEFLHPTRGKSQRYRLIYNSIDHALSPQQVLQFQKRLHAELVDIYGVEMR